MMLHCFILIGIIYVLVKTSCIKISYEKITLTFDCNNYHVTEHTVLEPNLKNKRIKQFTIFILKTKFQK